ncbi:magnesium transporter [Elioraea sp. Yellowstone]|jgi:magnesium transporter|uniref:magnesium transporter CorA family protein n=1 Tax=Elioraea sp. Yellowstone TaxID=2592070 RepID=UPI0011549FAC|nr:magnesium transporter CorA family protein [Elioraea sp. Yellowstone]TQF77379.1 magnesium transporter [Elioraea sp. Yellowstone]
MITTYRVEGGRLIVGEAPHPPSEGAAAAPLPVWIDLLQPTWQEERMVERLIGVELPTREEQQEIEASSRLYREGEALFLTTPVMHGADTGEPGTAAITFVLTAQTLVTVRHATPRAFGIYAARAAKNASLVATADGVMLGLFEQVVDRLADVLERITADMDRSSAAAFRAARSSEPASTKNAALKEALITLGRVGDATARANETLLGLARIMAFITAEKDSAIRKENKPRIKTLARDLRSLQEHAKFLNEKATFLLDAVLGVINIEQTAVIKTFSVVAVALMPPTLIASIYGMNFEHMPELGWSVGYPLSLVAMVVSAVLPVIYFRRKGWL